MTYKGSWMSDVFGLRQDGDVAIVVLRHDVGSLTDSDVLTEVESLLERLDAVETRGVVIDFAKVEYFGSTLLEALLRVWHKVSNEGKSMALCNVKAVGLEILEVSKFTTLWPICPTRKEAAEAVRNGVKPEG